MFKNRIFKNVLFKWIPHKEQNVCERRLIKVVRRLKIEDFNFNWDRSSCFIEFRYKDEPYRLEHSVDKAKEKGIILRNGLDCINDLTQSLEDLCEIIDRGTYRFETWISGMKQTSAQQETPEYEEEFHIRYKSSGKQTTPEYNREADFIPFGPESSLRDFEQEENIPQPQRK